jgi:hypothetical protein
MFTLKALNTGGIQTRFLCLSGCDDHCASPPGHKHKDIYLHVIYTLQVYKLNEMHPYE